MKVKQGKSIAVVLKKKLINNYINEKVLQKSSEFIFIFFIDNLFIKIAKLRSYSVLPSK